MVSIPHNIVYTMFPTIFAATSLIEMRYGNNLTRTKSPLQVGRGRGHTIWASYIVNPALIEQGFACIATIALNNCVVSQHL